MRNSRELPGPSFASVPDSFPVFGRGFPLSAAFPAGLSRTEITPADGSFYARRGKRALDLVLSGAALLVFLPLFPLIALALRLERRGPVIDRSTRQGEKSPFQFYKFRSLSPGATEKTGPALGESTGPLFACAQDLRVTRVGRFLRRTSLDELPQLYNVWRGDMSLVGPRPPLAGEADRYEPWQRMRLNVKPGITCLWQVSGRSALSFDEWMRLDIEYVRNRSLALDLHILLRTVPAVLSREGAY